MGRKFICFSQILALVVLAMIGAILFSTIRINLTILNITSVISVVCNILSIGILIKLRFKLFAVKALSIVFFTGSIFAALFIAYFTIVHYLLIDN